MSLRHALIVGLVVALVGMQARILRADEPGSAPDSKPAPPKETVEEGKAEETAEVPAYWLGIACSPLSDALRAQLSLKDNGLLVEEVASKSPAQKAGIERHDVLLSADDHPLQTVDDLVEAIARYDGTNAITLEIMRRARKMTIEVTPEKRPPEYFKPHEIVLRTPDFSQESPSVPPVLAPRRVPIPGVLPPIGKPAGNLRISITKSNNQPAAIEVVKDGKTYKVTENTLDQLPEDVRKPVKDMLDGMQQRRVGQPTLPPGIPPDFAPLFPPLPTDDGSLDETIDEMGRALESMRQRIKALRDQKQADKNAPSSSEAP